MPLKICVLLTHTTDGQTWFFALDSKWTETPLNFSASLFEAIFCPFLPNWGARMRFELNFVLCSGKVEQATVFALKQVCVRPFNSCLLPKGQATEKSNENIPFLLGCISMQIHKIYLFVCRGGKPKYQRIPKLPPFVKARKPQWQNKPTGSWMTATAEKNVKNVQNYCWDSRQRERERKKRQICDNFFVVLHLHGFCPPLGSFFVLLRIVCHFDSNATLLLPNMNFASKQNLRISIYHFNNIRSCHYMDATQVKLEWGVLKVGANTAWLSDFWGTK